ncbi:MAG: hypothetical protein U0L19_10835 [Bacteroidales bacterium]|jgi:hypothetical protein|nr:hypothetical protein [Bacteroidales bacterium]
MSKKTKQFEDLVADLTDLKDWEFKEAIAIAKQFRRAQKRLGKAMDRQEREFALPKKAKSAPTFGGLNYELQ